MLKTYTFTQFYTITHHISKYDWLEYVSGSNGNTKRCAKLRVSSISLNNNIKLMVMGNYSRLP